jgi:hypothetical protein
LSQKIKLSLQIPLTQQIYGPLKSKVEIRKIFQELSKFFLFHLASGKIVYLPNDGFIFPYQEKLIIIMVIAEKRLFRRYTGSAEDFESSGTFSALSIFLFGSNKVFTLKYLLLKPLKSSRRPDDKLLNVMVLFSLFKIYKKLLSL